MLVDDVVAQVVVAKQVGRIAEGVAQSLRKS